MSWADLEELYWRFDAMHKGYGEWAGTPMSERDAFKRTVQHALAEKDRQLKDYISAAEVDRRIGERQCDGLTDKLALKDREIAHLEEKVAHYDRWLSAGVYFTGEEYQEQVYKPRQQLMAQAVRFSQYIYTTNNIFSQMPIYLEAEAFLKEHTP